MEEEEVTEEQARQLVLTDPNFVFDKKRHFSIAELEARYPDGCPDAVIAHALMIPEAEVEARYQNVVTHLRDIIGVDDDE